MKPTVHKLVALTWVVAALAPAPARAQTTLRALVRPNADPASELAAEQLSARLSRLVRASRFRWSDAGQGLASADAAEIETALKGALVQLAQARQAYADLDVARAVPLATNVVTTYERYVAAWDDPTPLLDAMAVLAACSFFSRADAEATRWLQRAFALDRAFRADPDIFNPPMQRQIESLRGQLGRVGGGAEIITRPTSSVFIDGVWRGLSPLVLSDLGEGRHYLRVVKQGFDTVGRAFEVVAGIRTTVRLELRETPDVFGLRTLALQLDTPRGPRTVELVELGAKAKVDLLLDLHVEAQQGKPTRVAARLFGLELGVPLREVALEVPADAPPSIWDEVLGKLLGQLAPGSMTLAVSVALDAAVAPEVGTSLKRRLAETLERAHASLSMLSEPVAATCYASTKCIAEATHDVSGGEGLVRVEAALRKGATQVSLSIYDGQQGDIVGREILTLPANNEVTLAGGLLRGVDRLWERRAAVEHQIALNQQSVAERARQEQAAAQQQLERAAARAVAVRASRAAFLANLPFPWRRSGWIGAAAGVVTTAAGFTLSLRQASVLREPASLGADKRKAVRTGRITLALTGTGLLALAAGVVIGLMAAPMPEYIEPPDDERAPARPHEAAP